MYTFYFILFYVVCRHIHTAEKVYREGGVFGHRSQTRLSEDQIFELHIIVFCHQVPDTLVKLKAPLL
jgi:hypothetical protein